jgi:hypothetical protein
VASGSLRGRARKKLRRAAPCRSASGVAASRIALTGEGVGGSPRDAHRGCQTFPVPDVTRLRSTP